MRRSAPNQGINVLAYIDAGTAAAIAAMATGGLAGAKVAAQSFVASKRNKKGNTKGTTASTVEQQPVADKTKTEATVG